MISMEIINEDNPDYHTHGGPPTTDIAFLLSIEELRHFVLDEETRVYGASWWLRSPGYDQKSVPIVDHEGYMRPGVSVQAFNGVRPAMWIKIV